MDDEHGGIGMRMTMAYSQWFFQGFLLSCFLYGIFWIGNGVRRLPREIRELRLYSQISDRKRIRSELMAFLLYWLISILLLVIVYIPFFRSFWP